MFNFRSMDKRSDHVTKKIFVLLFGKWYQNIATSFFNYSLILSYTRFNFMKERMLFYSAEF